MKAKKSDKHNIDTIKSYVKIEIVNETGNKIIYEISSPFAGQELSEFDFVLGIEILEKYKKKAKPEFS